MALFLQGNQHHQCGFEQRKREKKNYSTHVIHFKIDVRKWLAERKTFSTNNFDNIFL